MSTQLNETLPGEDDQEPVFADLLLDKKVKKERGSLGG